jgi:tRNA pseudouridine55 synthase
LFVAEKPIFIGSNTFLSRIKRRYGVKKAGFSGTLDPFARGTLIVAFGQYTRLFRFLKKTPKTYRATLCLGAHSPTLDIEGIDRIESVAPVNPTHLQQTLAALEGDFTYIPPAFSAKKINGRRAYDLARSGRSADLPPVTSRIHAIRLLHYRHPFITFEADVDEGTYIRSLGSAIAEKLGTVGALSHLHRIREGAFVFENEKPLDPLDFLAPPPNHYLKNPEDLLLGRKLAKSDFAVTRPGTYVVTFDPFFAMIELSETSPTADYLLNKVQRC